MSVAVEVEPRTTTPSSTRLPGQQWLRRNIWPLGDQVLISAANFITMVLSARSLGKAEFGAFSLVYSALLLANVVQSTLVIQAHNVLGATRDGLAYRIYTTTTTISQFIFIAAEAIVAAVIAAILHAKGVGEPALLVALIPSIVGWQLQEFIRRVLYTEGRTAAAFANDVISYAGQTVWIALLWYRHSLTGPLAFYALAWTSLAAAVIGFWQIRSSLCLKLDWSAIVENWQFGKWLAAAELVGWCSSLHMFLYLAAIFIGVGATGEMRAAQLIFGPTRVISFFLGNVLPIRFARALTRGGNELLDSGFRKVITAIIPMLGGFCLLAALFAGQLLKLVYGKDYTGDPRVLQLYALCAFVTYMQMVVNAALSAKRLTRAIFVSSAFGGVIALSLSWPLIKLMGVNGAMVCMIVTAVIVTAFCYRAYRRSIALHRGFDVIFPGDRVTA